MALRSAPIPAAISKGATFGLETTTGTAVAPTKRFGGFGLDKSREMNIGTVRPMGVKMPTKHTKGRESATYSIADGVLSYTECVWPLAGMFVNPPVVAVGSTTTLTAAVTTTTQTSISVASAVGFPTTGTYRIRVGAELMDVTGGQGTLTWTVARGVGGSTAATHASGASVTETAPTGATGAFGRTFTMNPFGRDAVASYTLEHGNQETNRGGIGAGALFTELGFSVNANGENSEMSGAMISPKLQTGTLADVEIDDFVPVLPTQWDLFLDDSFATIGQTQIMNVFNLSHSLGDRRNPVYFLARAFDSYAGTVEQAPSASIALNVADEANPVDDVLLSLEQGDRLYLRAQATGPMIEGNTPFLFRFDACLGLSASPDEGDTDEAASVELTFEPEADEDLNGITIYVQNDVANLNQ